MKRKKSNTGSESPALPVEWFDKARPAAQVLPASVLAAARRKPGRPPKEAPKEAVKLRIDPDVLAVLRATGPGWQTRVNTILRERFAL